MGLFGDSISDHRKRGHTTWLKYEDKVVNGKLVRRPKRWVCSCGRTFRA